MSMITVVGNLVADPEQKTAGGQKLARMRIATNERKKNAEGQWVDGDTTYIDVSCWRKLAEASSSLRKGQKVIVYGKLKGRDYQRKDGTKGYGYEIEATELGTHVFSKQVSAPEPDLDNPWS
jgi:single-strand DNA-binding protein